MKGFQILLFCGVGVNFGAAYPNPSSKFNIVGGNVTDISKVPYQAALLFDGMIFCGASIISQNLLLTACGTLLKIKKVYKHPKCHMDLYMLYDACIVETASPMRFGKKIKPVTIAAKAPHPEDFTLVAGWGATQESGEVSDVLLSVYVPVTNKSYCQEVYSWLPNTETVLCAGAEGKDSCQGDSGGGLIWNDRLVGIVSGGQGCARAGFPGIYTNAVSPEIRKFIKDVSGA